MTTALTKFDQAHRALAEAKTIDEIKDVRDKAEALRLYVKQQGDGLEMQNDIAEIKIRAERRAGELLAEMERGRTGPKLSESLSDNSEYRQALDDSGIGERTARSWQRAARIPEETFEQHVVKVKADGEKELTSAGVQRLAQKLEREQRTQEKEVQPLPDGMYRIIYADPPWKYKDSGVITEDDNYGRATRHYPTMSITELCEKGSEIQELTADDAVLFLWVTSPMLEVSFKVIKAWGFKYKTSFVWDKVKHNFGHYNSVRHEFLLICTKGSCTPDISKLFDSVQSVERSAIHSEKPEEFREIIETLYIYGRRIELFGRKPIEGWEVWGNEPTL